jgi:hypothetical protein
MDLRLKFVAVEWVAFRFLAETREKLAGKLRSAV